MNANDQKIFESYRNGDFTHRLHLFLEYRHLRAQFMEIDQKFRVNEFAPRIEMPWATWSSKVNNLRNLVNFNLRRLFGAKSAGPV